MHRLTVLGRSLASGLCQTGVKSTTPITGTVQTTQTRGNAGGPPGKLECFVDGKKVLVDPGTTVLQVRKLYLMHQKVLNEKQEKLPITLFFMFGPSSSHLRASKMFCFRLF